MIFCYLLTLSKNLLLQYIVYLLDKKYSLLSEIDSLSSTQISKSLFPNFQIHIPAVQIMAEATGREAKKGPPNVDGMFTLKVDGIASNATPDSLKALFGKVSWLDHVSF